MQRTRSIIPVSYTHLLIILGSIDFNGKKESVQYTNIEFYTEYLENKIARMCENIGGISEAKILLTLDCSSEYVYGDSASDYIILKNNNEEEAVMLREIYPRVRGIAVVCTGGDLPRIRETVTDPVSYTHLDVYKRQPQKPLMHTASSDVCRTDMILS